MFKRFQEKVQSFAGAMMVPIILFVLVGFYVGIGSAVNNYLLPENSWLQPLFGMFVNMGFLFMNYLPIWFAVGVAFTLAKKEKGWAAFAGVVLFFTFNVCLQTLAKAHGYTAETTTADALIASGMAKEAALNFSSMFTSVAGIFTYNMGIFSGLISGVVAALIHNRLVDKSFANTFAFFGGVRWVIINVTFSAVVLGYIFYYLWPLLAYLLQSLTHFIGVSGLFGTFVFGTLDKALLPFGIHHLIAFPIEYSAVGGTMNIDGVVYEGVKNIINGQAASATATGYIVRNFTNGRLLFQLAGLPGAALAMYKLALPENKKRVASILIPAVFTLALVGISEPIEYTFLFVAPALYWLVYAPLCGLMYVLAEFFQISINGTALLFMIPNLAQPHKVHAIHALWLLPLTFALYYFVFSFVIKRFDLPTPGRRKQKQAEIKLFSKQDYRNQQAENAQAKSEKSSATSSDTADLVERIISAFGGSENIEAVGNCATRLRVTVFDGTKVADTEYWLEHLEAKGVLRGDKNFQIIYGVQVGQIATTMRERLNLA